MSLFETVLSDLEAEGPSPKLTWYADEGRIELSGKVLSNWIIKSANFMDSELSIGPGTALAVDLAPHWKTSALILAGLTCGAEVNVLDREQPVPAESFAAVFTDRPVEVDADADAEDVVAVELASLARSFSQEMPPMCLDWTQDVRSHGDRLGATSRPPTAQAALRIDDTELTYHDLDELYSEARRSGSSRIGTRGERHEIPRWLIRTIFGGGSIVLAPAGVTSAIEADEGLSET